MRRTRSGEKVQTDAALPVVVSFFTNEPYYREAAERLRQDCEASGLDFDIAQRSATRSESWLDVCRAKVQFFLEMHKKHRRPILWLDVDTRLGKRPEVLKDAKCDLAGFLRGLRYLRDFDPLSSPRFFAPFALYFNATAPATRFLEKMAAIENSYTGTATDDYFLHEAWLQHEQQMSVMVLPPELVGEQWPLEERQVFCVGRSGNVSKFKATAQQHTGRVVAPAHRQGILLYEGDRALEAGDVEDALLLYRRALSAQPNEGLAAKIARKLRRQGQLEQAHALLRECGSVASQENE
jgi:hypothetical protein